MYVYRIYRYEIYFDMNIYDVTKILQNGSLALVWGSVARAGPQHWS